MRVALAAIQGMVTGWIYCIMRATPIGRDESAIPPGVRPWGGMATATAEFGPCRNDAGGYHPCPTIMPERRAPGYR